MKTYHQKGEVMTLTAPSGGVVSGVPLLIGSLFVVPMISAAEAELFSALAEGVVSYTKTSAQAWTECLKVYWNTSTSKFDSDGTTGPLVGVAAAVADNPSTLGYVRLNGVAPATAEGPQALIADLNLTALTDTPATADALRDNLTATWETEIEGKVNAILAALRTATIIAT